MIKRFMAWRRQRERDKALVTAAEAFVDQFLFTGREGLVDGECDYAIVLMLKAMQPPMPMREDALRNHKIVI